MLAAMRELVEERIGSEYLFLVTPQTLEHVL